MLPEISVILLTWNRPPGMLNNSLWTLTHQTVLPQEIIVVEVSPSNAYHTQTKALCALYPLVKLIEGHWSRFNYSRGINVGIKRAAYEYIMPTCMEMLFAENFIESVLQVAQSNRYINVPCGSLPEGIPIGSAEQARRDWEILCTKVVPYPPNNESPGAISLAHRDWWFKVHGFDEPRRPYSYPDVDICNRAIRSGLQRYIVEWGITQCIHPFHPSGKMFYTVSGYYVDVNGADRDICRNPVEWGVLDGDEPKRIPGDE